MNFGLIVREPRCGFW